MSRINNTLFGGAFSILFSFCVRMAMFPLYIVKHFFRIETIIKNNAYRSSSYSKRCFRTLQLFLHLSMNAFKNIVNICFTIGVNLMSIVQIYIGLSASAFSMSGSTRFILHWIEKNLLIF